MQNYAPQYVPLPTYLMTDDQAAKFGLRLATTYSKKMRLRACPSCRPVPPTPDEVEQMGRAMTAAIIYFNRRDLRTEERIRYLEEQHAMRAEAEERRRRVIIHII